MQSSEESGEGSLNPLQDSNENENGPIMDNDNVLNESSDSARTAAESLQSATISMCSESSLLVPGKLYTDISKLKSCYTDILRYIYKCSHTPSATESVSDADVLLLTREQLISACKRREMKAEVAKLHLVNLIEATRPVCIPNYQNDPRPKRSPVDCQLLELSKCVETLSSQNLSQFETLKSELETLKSTVSNYENMLSQTPLTPSQTTQTIDIPTDSALPVIDIPHIERSLDNYLSEDECVSLRAELTDLPYAREKGRLTMRYGEHYTYNGSRGEAVVEFPPGLKAMLDKLNEQFIDSDTPLLNSCVVNKYVGPTSFIPSHSDDERSIHPNSSIFTVSIGKDATVRFTDISNNATHEHVASSGSLYSMSRRSQSCYKHQINKDSSWAGSDVRLSITFRAVHWRNNNSTLILGDSNTGGLKFASFGHSSSSDMNGTFGNAMPGHREAVFVVDDLDAAKCLGYNNVVVHCGVNDVRKPDIETEDHIREIYVKFKSKINQILHVNKRARVYVDLLLPTKLEACNSKIKYFNKLIAEDLCKSYNRVKIIDTFKKFCDSNGFLAKNLSREFTRDNLPDNLHLNDGGLKLLSVAIKNVIFYKKRQEGSTHHSGGGEGVGGSGRQQSTGGTYSGIVSRPSYRGRRGGYNQRGRGRARQP